jgi:hypothetical protein
MCHRQTWDVHLVISIPYIYSCVTFFLSITNHTISTPPNNNNLHSLISSINNISLLQQKQTLQDINNGIQTNPIPQLLPHIEELDPRRTSLCTQHRYSTSTRSRQLCPSTTDFPHCSCFCSVLCVSFPTQVRDLHTFDADDGNTVLFWAGPGWRLPCSKKLAFDS